jgi:hypothetical protein
LVTACGRRLGGQDIFLGLAKPIDISLERSLAVNLQLPQQVDIVVVRRAGKSSSTLAVI